MRISDSAHVLLLDALCVGSLSYKPEEPRKGACGLCLLLDGRSTLKTTRHIALECPFSALAQETVLLRATTLEVMTPYDNTRKKATSP
jgi:hypothetical protein